MKLQVPENVAEFFDYLHNWRLLKKASAPWSELLVVITRIII
jgi:hypothetical protein